MTMGKLTTNGAELANKVLAGRVLATGASQPVSVFPTSNPLIFSFSGDWNLTLWAGAAAGGTVVLERSFDGGTTWAACTMSGASVPLVIAASSALTEVIREPEAGVLYRINCTAFTAAFDWRASQ
jgi:hypothetical protein